MLAVVAFFQAIFITIVLGYRFLKKCAWLPALAAIALISVLPPVLIAGSELQFGDSSLAA